MAIDKASEGRLGERGLTPQCQHSDKERLAGLPPLARHPWACHLPPLSPFCFPPTSLFPPQFLPGQQGLMPFEWPGGGGGS